MKSSIITYERILSGETVDEFSQIVRDYLLNQKLPKRDVMRFAMSVEEILLDVMESGEKKKVALSTGIRFRHPFITLEIFGEADNVYLHSNDAQSALGNQILRSLDLAPEYRYSDSKNVYQFRVPRKQINPFLSLAIAIGAAVLLGLIGMLFPQSTRDTIINLLLNPLNDTFLNVLGCIAGPMVFLPVAWGIFGIGDAATLKQVGIRLLLGYISYVFIVVVLVSVVCLPIFSLSYTKTAGSAGELSSLLSMLTGIFPKNIFSPFVDGNTLQIIFLASVVGVMILILGRKTGAIATGVGQVNTIIQQLMSGISRLVPFFIFIVLLKMIWSDVAAVFLSVGKILIVYISVEILNIIGILLLTSVKNQVSPLLLAKKGLPALLVGLTTASSAATYGINMGICTKEYGIDEKVTAFGLPLGMVLFKPNTAISYSVLALFFAEYFQVEISVTWLVLLIITITILALATPPIPGGALASYTVLFSQLGIPGPEALAIALACDTLLDFLSTGGDQFIIPYALLNRAAKLGLVNRSILLKKKVKKIKKDKKDK